MDCNRTAVIPSLYRYPFELDYIFKEPYNKIVESIAQLSAVSEEVTANSQQASELSDENVRQMNDAAEKIEAVKERIVGLAKYQDMIK